jgi:predicted lipid-binding transport protein (Tim44 family)
MTDRFPAPHAEHDQLLIAALAAGDLQPADRAPAEQLVATCPDCALLVDDLRTIAVATAALPARARPRDFSIHPEDAARLGRRGWRGIVAVLAGQRAAGLKPLATGLTTLGIAGLLLAAMPSIQLGSSAGSASPTGASTAPTHAPAADAPSREGDTMGQPAASGSPPDGAQQFGPASAASGNPAPVAGQASSPVPLDRVTGDESPAVPDRFTTTDQPDAALNETRPASPLVLLSGVFLVVGLALFGIRWTARLLNGHPQR